MQWEWELVERAKEELHILEAEHPNKYESLKMDLKAFISDFDDMLQQQQQNSNISSTPTAESSSGRKKRQHDVFVDSKMKKRCKSKTDAVLHKAHQCLHKIQHLKTILHNL